MEVIFHPRYIDHQQKGTHPEKPDRLRAILHRLEEEGLHDDILVPDNASKEQILAIHTERYYDTIQASREGYIDGGDTYLRRETYDIASLAVGGAMKSLELAKQGRINIALLRPPGHHSGKDYGGGFCYFNNIAIAAKLSEYDRVAIIDFDGHHGNGTSDIFYRDPSVLYVSAHNHGIYPGTGDSYAVGEGEGVGTNVNLPFKTGIGDSTLNLAWEKVIQPVVEQYDPELILFSVGTDGHYKDQMTGLSYSSQSFIDLAKKSIDLSNQTCDGRISFMLEGGYHLETLSEIIAGIVAIDENKEIELKYTKVSDNNEKGKESVEDTLNALKHHWEL